MRFGEVELRARVKIFGGGNIFWESGMFKKMVCKPQSTQGKNDKRYLDRINPGSESGAGKIYKIEKIYMMEEWRSALVFGLNGPFSMRASVRDHFANTLLFHNTKYSRP